MANKSANYRDYQEGPMINVVMKVLKIKNVKDAQYILGIVKDAQGNDLWLSFKNDENKEIKLGSRYELEGRVYAKQHSENGKTYVNHTMYDTIVVKECKS